MSLSQKQKDTLQSVLIHLNKTFAPAARQLVEEDFNLLISAVDHGQLIVGGDSACFHIKDNKDGSVVLDCTPPKVAEEKIDESCCNTVETRKQGLDGVRHSMVDWLQGGNPVQPSFDDIEDEITREQCKKLWSVMMKTLPCASR